MLTIGKVVELWSVGTFRARFLVEEWQSLLARFDGDSESATRAHSSLCRDWERIWDVDASKKTEDEEGRLTRLSDAKLLQEWHRVEVDSPSLDLIAGEMERRNLDD